LVVNRQSPDNALLGTEDLEQCLSKKVAFVVPDDPRTVGAAINMGQPLMTFAPRSKVREAIKVIAEAINAPRDKEADKAGAGRKGLLSKVFSR